MFMYGQGLSPPVYFFYFKPELIYTMSDLTTVSCRKNWENRSIKLYQKQMKIQSVTKKENKL